MINKESSIAGNITGIQMPGGNKQKKKNVVDVSKPYEEMDPELFENLVIESELQGKSIDEVVRKQGSLYTLFDDDTDKPIMSFKNRKAAWEKQRDYRRRKGYEKKQAKSKHKKEKEHEKITKQLFAGKKKKKPQKLKKEDISQMMQGALLIEMVSSGLLKENVLEYVFENQPNTDTLEWDSFLKGLSKDAIMSDEKLKKIIGNLMSSESKILKKSMNIVKDRLLKAGFEIKQSKISADPTNGRIRGDFYIYLKDEKKDLPFGIRVENGRPLIFIPDETKQQLNNIQTPSAKMLRSELIHAQETALDVMDDVIKASGKRDQYFGSLEKNLDKMMNNLNSVEIAMLRKLIKTKYKNV